MRVEQKGIEKLGHATGPESKAQLDLGTSVPYNYLIKFKNY